MSDAEDQITQLDDAQKLIESAILRYCQKDYPQAIVEGRKAWELLKEFTENRNFAEERAKNLIARLIADYVVFAGEITGQMKVFGDMYLRQSD